MIKQALIEGFNKSTYGNYQSDGERVLRNDLISDFTYENEKDKIVLMTSVISENLYSQYSCKIDLDKSSKEILWTHCTCNTFEKKGTKKSCFCCKHIVASFLKFINLLDEYPNIKEELGFIEKKEAIIEATQSSILDLLVGSKEEKKEINFEVILNKISWTGKIAAEFKIGILENKSSKMYTLKDIDSFLIALYNKVPIKYGKDFIFNIKEQSISVKIKRLIKFIELLKEIDLSSGTFRKANEKLVSGKQITIPSAMLREFMSITKGMRIYLGSGFYSRVIETEVISDSISIPVNLKEVGNLIKLEIPTSLPEPLNDSNDVFLYNTIIYLPPYEQIEKIIPYIEAFSHSNALFFTKSEEERVLKELIPSIQNLTKDIELSNSIKNKIVISPVSFKFYFDKSDEIFLTLKVCYDKYEFNFFDTFEEKVIYRDNFKENLVIQKLRELGFQEVNNHFIFFKDDEYIFRFFKEEILELQEYGEVYYSDNFTGIKSINNNSFSGNIKKGKYDYFELKFKIADIAPEETNMILRAFRDNKKFYKLNTGEFLDLEEIELQKFLKLIDTLEQNSNLNNNIIEFNKNKGLYVEDFLNENNISCIRGRNHIKSLKKSIENLKTIDFEVPSNINATLRNYQIEGYKWLKNLDYLGFGGLLGDEMGLGKTLQTITFILSTNNSKSLIITPTSLIYNWYNEFNKFAPSLKVGMITGNKIQREDIINKLSNYDVLITTYNLLKRDIDLYDQLEFDYCIIDEAQNIKNHNSLNAKTVKSINARRRFALTGTPIENSLMELWSIFDFIMPGYLYDEKRFVTRYHRRLDEDDCIIKELNRLIKPFILRRYKKDVIHELPPKIEKQLIIPLFEEQQKVYTTYSNYAKELLEQKVKDDEFKSSKIEILSYITKLRQICLDPSMVMDNYSGGSSKIDALLETLLQGIDEGHKILVFSQFTTALNKISKLLTDNNITFLYLDGSTPSKKRNALVNEFNNSNIPVFLISLKAGGTGLNLTSADIVIHFDPWWNPAVEDQATDRAHRIGQENVVEVIKMISEGTIEEKIISLQQQKKILIEKVVGEGMMLSDGFAKLNEEDIFSLFER